MCYTGKCKWEGYWGDCQAPWNGLYHCEEYEDSQDLLKEENS